MRNSVFNIGILLILFFVFTGQIFAQNDQPRTLTFQDAYRQMNKNSHVLKQSGFLLKEKEAAKKAAIGLRMPRISVTANAIKMAEPLELDLTPVRDAINPLYTALGNYGVFSGVPNPDPATSSVMPVLPDKVSTQVIRGKILEGQQAINEAEWVKTIQKEQFAAVNANLVLPIYTGGKINAAIKASKLEEEEAGINNEIKQSELLTELATRYYGLCLSKQAVKVREQVLEAMQKHLFDAQKLSEQGQIARVEFLHAQVAVSSAERELKKAIREQQIIERALQNTLVLGDSNSVNPASPLFILKQIEDETFFTNLAVSNNPQLKLVDSKKKMAGVGVAFEKSNYLPMVALSGTYDLADKDLSPYIPEWTVGVGLKWNLFEGNTRYRKLQSAKFKQDQVEQFSEKAMEDVLTGIKKYHQELGMQAEQLEGLNKTLEFAGAYLESRQKAFKEGLSTSSELVDANLLVAKTKIERLQAMYYYDITLASLLQVCGTPEKYLGYLSGNDIITESL